MLTSAYLFFEFLAFATSLVRFDIIKHTRYKYFVPYLLFILVYEFGSFKNWFLINRTNLWISNITLIIFFLFYSLFNYGLIRSQRFKGWIKWSIIISILLSIVNMLWGQGFWALDTITILVEFAILITISCLYFYELMYSSGKQMRLLQIPGFWLNTGLLFFCLGQFLFFALFAYMAYSNNYKYYFLHSILANICNAILYSCLTKSFLCIKTKS